MFVCLNRPVEKFSPFPLRFRGLEGDKAVSRSEQWDMWARKQLMASGSDVLGKFSLLQVYCSYLPSCSSAIAALTLFYLLYAFFFFCCSGMYLHTHKHSHYPSLYPADRRINPWFYCGLGDASQLVIKQVYYITILKRRNYTFSFLCPLNINSHNATC